MKKHFGKKLLGSVLAGAMVVTTVAAPTASAADTNLIDGQGQVYSVSDIIDVVVPTTFKIAVNPLKVAVTGTSTAEGTLGLKGNTQILSGVYAIQNRSTVPVNMKLDFTVSGGTSGKTVLSKPRTAANVAVDEANTAATYASFSLDMITTAAKAAQAATPGDREESVTTDVRTDTALENVTIAKKAAEPIKLTESAAGADATAKSVNFTLAAGPYTASYDKDSDTVKYVANPKGTFDAVGFTFSGTTTTNMANWAKTGATAKVTAKYTLTKMTSAAYDSAYFSPVWKAVALSAKADAPGGSVVVAKTVNAKTGAISYSTAANTITFDSASLAWNAKHVYNDVYGSGATKKITGKSYGDTVVTFQRLDKLASKVNVKLTDILKTQDVGTFDEGTTTDPSTGESRTYLRGKIDYNLENATDDVADNATAATKVTVTNASVAENTTTNKTVITVDNKNFYNQLETLGYGFYQVTIGKVSTIIYYGAAAIK